MHRKESICSRSYQFIPRPAFVVLYIHPHTVCPLPAKQQASSAHRAHFASHFIFSLTQCPSLWLETRIIRGAVCPRIEAQKSTPISTRLCSPEIVGYDDSPGLGLIDRILYGSLSSYLGNPVPSAIAFRLTYHRFKGMMTQH